jgi:hypothetical protein
MVVIYNMLETGVNTDFLNWRIIVWTGTVQRLEP